MKRFFCIVILLTLVGCHKDHGGMSTDPNLKPGPPNISWGDVWNITDSSAITWGTALFTNGAPITDKGIIWYSASDVANKYRHKAGDCSNDFYDTLRGLKPSTIYFVSVYATNSYGDKSNWIL